MKTMRGFSRLTGGLVGLAFLGMTGTANASLIGHTVLAEWLFPNTSNVIESHVVVVGTGIELPATTILNDTKFDIDIGGDFVQWIWNSGAGWQNIAANGWRFTDLTGGLTISGYSIGAGTTAGVAGLEAADLSFTANSVFGNFGASGASRVTVAGGSDIIELKIAFAVPNAVPEPSTLTLFTIALGGLGFMARRRVGRA